MEKRQILGVVVMGVIALGALGVGILEKVSIKKAELAEKRRLEALRYPEPILEAQPIPLTADEMAAEIGDESLREEELLTSEEAMLEEDIASDIQMFYDLTSNYGEDSF